jgi:carbonic anhydrase
MKKILICVLTVYITFSALAATHEIIKGISPDDAMKMLLNGNKRFASSQPQHPHQSIDQRIKTAKQGQKPFATILSCSDSRVPLEIIFDAGIGDIFVIRNAGNVVEKVALGSIEYSIEHLGSKLIVVLGHTKCGAVTAVVNKDQVGGNMTGFTDKIKPAVAKTRADHKDLAGEALILESTKANVRKSIEDIIRSSRDVSELVKTGKIKIVGAIYDVEKGTITKL